MIVAVGPGMETLFTAAGWAARANAARDSLQAYHRQYPLRPGMPREELRNRLGLKAGPFLQVLARLSEESVLVADDAHVWLPGFSPVFTAPQKAVVDSYVASLGGTPFAPPTDQKVDPEVVNALVMQGLIVRANEDVVFLKSAYDEMSARVVERIRATGKVSVSDVRDMFGQSRKYVLALLEHMDRLQVTRRLGDDRVLR
jgi:selenocysteine-specific elongation factor